MVFNNLYMKNKTANKKTTLSVNLSELIFKENKDKNMITLGIDNVKLDFDAHNDSLLIDLSWNDDTEEDKNKGELSALFIPNGADSGKLYLSSSDMIINDTAWNISQGCYLDIKGSNLSFNNMNLYSNNQSVIVNGYFPTMSKDTLSVNFNNLDIFAPLLCEMYLIVIIYTIHLYCQIFKPNTTFKLFH